MRFSSSLAAAALSLASVAHALPKVTRSGRYLYQEDGTRFYFKGVAYQEQGVVITSDSFQEPSTFIDPLADTASCTRDLPYLKQLGVNSIRVYSVDPANNHDDCMAMFSGAGIYTIIDLSQPNNGSIDRNAPTWTSNLLNLYLQTIDAFSKYDNVLGYTVGNEVVRDVPSTAAAPFIKAAARDVKAYIQSKGYTGLVTYATTDGSNWRNDLATYLSCGNDTDTVDIFGLNNYEWKGNATIASYGGSNAFFEGINIPVYFSEFGSADTTEREFTEVDALFGTEMSAIWSGGFAFSYFQSSQPGFGLVNISSDGTTVTTLGDFTRLQAHYANVTFIQTPSQADAGTTQFPACQLNDPTNFVASLSLPPTPNQADCNCAVADAFRCVFTPQTTNVSSIEGPLFDYTCAQLGGLSNTACNDLSANGTTGEYGFMSSCDPATQLSYVFTAFYFANNANSASCSFSGNASINTNAPNDSADASSKTQSCMATAQEVTTPTGPSSPASTSSSDQNSTSSSSGSGSSGSGTGSAVHLSLDLATFIFTVLFVGLGFAYVL